jgi:hypothetical protein
MYADNSEGEVVVLGRPSSSNLTAAELSDARVTRLGGLPAWHDAASGMCHQLTLLFQCSGTGGTAIISSIYYL